MTEDPDDTPRRPPSSSPPGEDRDVRLAALAVTAGLELPPFDAPLVAFDPAPEGAPGGPIYLGGDLHRIHPDAAEQYPGRHRDPSLDEARIVLGECEREDLVATAVEGVWCLAIFGEDADSALHFTLWDTQFRMRSWLLLPPPRLMIGLAHFWLPSVPPPPSFT